MNAIKHKVKMGLTLALTLLSGISVAQYNQENSIQKSGFQWPDSMKMALSLTFDDARLTQADNGLHLFDKYGVKATFYLSPVRMSQRLDAWKQATRNGHDIGNHSVLHPCTGNFKFARQSALENYTLGRMQTELDSANRIIYDLLGVKPVSFAYPCGQTFIGQGATTKSYVPLVHSMFETGRGWRDEGPNDPVYCDLSQLMGMEMDGKSFSEIKELIEFARKRGAWLVLAGHEISEGGRQTSFISTLDSICKYATDPSNGIWIDNVHNIASYIKDHRKSNTTETNSVYLNPLYPVDQRVEDLLSRMTLEEKLGQLNMPYPRKMSNNTSDQLEGCRKGVEGKYYANIGPFGGIWGTRVMFDENGAQSQAEFHNELQKIATEQTRLKIPLLFLDEGTHGYMAPAATIFPEGLAIGSTWDLDLIRRIYSVTAKEGRLRGVHFLGTLVIEPNRDPRLGRNIEAYSECPYLCSRIAEVVVEGIQGDNISSKDKAIALLCHFPGQSEPVSGLERGAMDISERELREVFLPPWVAGITRAGALGVMATYAAIDGVSTHVSEKLLTKILREELGFNGLVFCEGGGFDIPIYEKVVSTMKESGELGIKAGVDVSIYLEDAYLNPMMENVNEGKVAMETIDRAVRRILKVKFMLGLFENPYVNTDRTVNVINTEESRELARQVARDGIVLLKNENNLLPLNKNIKSIAVIGPNADAKINMLGDYTYTPVLQDVVTVLEGVRNKVSNRTKVNYVKGCDIIGDKLNEINKAKALAKKSDLAIIVVGESRTDVITTGEGYDVASLDLTGLQEELIKAVYETGTPTILVLINGRPLSINWTVDNIPAIVEGWNCGEQGGNAIADILFGDYNPSGRLPISFPRHSGQLPVYYNYKPSKAYWMNRRGGYVDMSSTPLYEFGFGLSYTSFEYSNLQITPKEIGPAGEVYISLDVKNSGSRDGKEVVQLYINDVISSISTPVKELKGFEKISLKVGEKKTVSFKLTPEHLSFLDRHLEPVVEPGIFEIMIGSSSEDIKLRGEVEVK